MTMEQAQAKCRKWREKGDTRSLAAANRLEAKFRPHPEYQSDVMWLLERQSGVGM
jgi:hypothetical protein